MQKSRFNPVYLLALIVLVAIWILSVSAILAQESEPTPPPWHYEGEEGPEHWGELGDEFALCGAGTAQSPIDVTGATELNISDISFNYGETAMSIYNNGHTIQVNVDTGTSSITYNGVAYELKQFHFHHPSEHSVNGEHAPLEVHFVHKDFNSDNLAVVGVMLVEGEAGAFTQVFDYLPAEKGDPDAMGMSIDVASLLPESTTFTTYNGSLTTPPCSEIVRWLVLDTPMTLSAEQIEAFATIFEMNARPVQPLNGRDLLHDEG